MLPFVLILLSFFGSFGDAVDFDLDIEGNAYVLDAERNLLVKYGQKGDSLRAVGGFGRSTETFDRPVALYARRGNDIFVADYNNHRIQRFNRRLEYVTTLYTREDADNQSRFGYPLDVAVSRQGDLHVLDGENRRVVVFDPSGQFIRSFGDISDGEGRMIDPQALELDDADNVYLLDGGEIRVYDPFGGWVGRIPTPENQPVLHFSIERDTMEIVNVSTLFFYDLHTKQYLPEIESDLEGVPGQIRRWGGHLYKLLKNRIGVYEFPAVESDTTER